MATLRDLGLSEYEARAYRSLLSTGPTTAKQLARASDVPMGRIYDVLNALEGAEMVRSQNAGRPKKYAAIGPGTALRRLLDDHRRELEARMEQYEAIVDELSASLESGEPPDEQFWTVAIGPDQAVDLLEERLGAATDRIVMVADKPSAGFDIGAVGERIASQFMGALDRDVEVTVLVSTALLDAVPDTLLRRYRSSIMGRPNFELRVTDGLSGAFTLVDRVEVCIEVPNPLDPDEAFALIDVTDPEFAANAYGMFEPRWTDARPLSQ